MAKSTAPFDIWHPQVTLTFSSCPGTRRTADEPQRCGRRPPSVLIQRARITLGRNDDAREKTTSAGSPSETRHNNARATACSSSTTLPRTPSHGARHHGSRTLAQRHFLPRGVPRGGRRACRSPATRYDDGFPHHPRDDSLTRPPSPSQFFSNFLPTPGGVMVPLAGPPVSGEARAVNRIIPVDVTVRLATTPRAIRTRTPPKFPERSRGVPAFWFVFLGFGKSMTRLHGRRRRRRRPTTRINSRRTSPG